MAGGQQAQGQNPQVLLQWLCKSVSPSVIPGKVHLTGRKFRSIFLSVCFKTVPSKQNWTLNNVEIGMDQRNRLWKWLSIAFYKFGHHRIKGRAPWPPVQCRSWAIRLRCKVWSRLHRQTAEQTLCLHWGRTGTVPASAIKQRNTDSATQGQPNPQQLQPCKCSEITGWKAVM